MKRKWALIAGGVLSAVVLLVGAAIAIQLYRSDDADLLTEAPAIPSATQASATATASASTPAGTVRYAVSSGSTAKYVVREKLSNLPTSTNAVGETAAVSGELFLANGQLSAGSPSTFQVDLRQLRSDESRRDNYLRQTTPRTAQYPNATFVLESASGGFPANYVDGSEVSFTAAAS